MRLRHRQLPPCKVCDTVVEAPLYNLVRLAFGRLGCPLGVTLGHLRGLEFYLDREIWLLADRTIGDLPVLAWSDFAPGRTHLHRPVACRLRYYHPQAERILPSLPQALKELIGGRLAAGAGGAAVTALR